MMKEDPRIIDSGFGVITAVYRKYMRQEKL